jgi:tRNA(Ile)-lysidine synthase
MTKKIYDFMEKHNMLTDCGAVIAGLSGGADSVCLLLVLKEIAERTGIFLTAVHINHGIRGEEAKRDEEFSRRLCGRLGVEFICRHIDVPSLAKKEHLSEEEAGRKARYEVFEELAKRKEEQLSGKCVRIATAHHKNDRAETVLMNMFRGSSLQGLRGIMPMRGNIIRPLLGVTRSEIEAYLSGKKQTFMVDSTNMDNAYSRNFVRNEVLPQIEKYSVNAVEHIADSADMIAEAHEYICMQADKLYTMCVVQASEHKKAVLELKAFTDEPAVVQRQVIYRLLGELSGGLKDIYRIHVEAVRSLCFMQSGKSVDIAYGIRAVRSYDTIIFGRICETKEDRQEQICISLDEKLLEKVWNGDKVTIPINAPVFFNDKILSENVVIELEKAELLENFVINDYTKFFDYDKITYGLTFRYRQSGDRIVVNCNGQSKSLKKELTDRKIPQAFRDFVLLLADGGQILWAAGVRRSEACLVEEASKRILKITIADTSVCI